MLDVGAGIGTVGAERADSGLARATLVEASPSYLETARWVLKSRFASHQTDFVLGDFVALADKVPKADVVTLDQNVRHVGGGRVVASCTPGNSWVDI